jgi:hypothetical protein
LMTPLLHLEIDLQQEKKNFYICAVAVMNSYPFFKVNFSQGSGASCWSSYESLELRSCCGIHYLVRGS